MVGFALVLHEALERVSGPPPETVIPRCTYALSRSVWPVVFFEPVALAPVLHRRSAPHAAPCLALALR
jgi:hypothetical protein